MAILLDVQVTVEAMVIVMPAPRHLTLRFVLAGVDCQAKVLAKSASQLLEFVSQLHSSYSRVLWHLTGLVLER